MKLRKSSAVGNAGPLIHLAKINLLHLLRKLYREIVIPREVKVEAVNRGKEKGFSNAFQIENALIEGWIRVEEVRLPEDFARTTETAGLKMAEAAVIYYAYKNRVTALLDEDSGRVFARVLGVPVRGSLGIILEGLRRNLISREEALKALDEISRVMYLSADLYRLLRREIERFAAERR